METMHVTWHDNYKWTINDGHSPLLLCHLFCPPSADLDLVGPPVQSCSVCCFFFFFPNAAALLLLLSFEATRALGAASVEPAVLVVRFDRAILLYSTHTAVLVLLLFAFLDGLEFVCIFTQTVSCTRVNKQGPWRQFPPKVYLVKKLSPGTVSSANSGVAPVPLVNSLPPSKEVYFKAKKRCLAVGVHHNIEQD